MEGFEEFDLLLPNKIFDEDLDIANIPYVHQESCNGNNPLNWQNQPGTAFNTAALTGMPIPDINQNFNHREFNRRNTSPTMHMHPMQAVKEEEPKQFGKRKKINYEGMSKAEIEHAKKTRRREQIAKASRLSRARRKQEMVDLREENKRLKTERETHIRKIKELASNVETLRKSGEIDVIKENEQLRTQLEQHKSFLACFKHLCDDNPQHISNSPSESLFTRGANAAHEQLMALLSQSVADSWKSVQIGDDLDLPYDDFSASFKLATEFGYSINDDQSSNRALKQRLNVRLDITYEGMEAAAIVEFLWDSLSSPSAQKRLYNVANLEVVQLEKNSISSEKNTRLYYYKEKNKAPLQDNDWVVIVNNRERKVPTNLLTSSKSRKKKQVITERPCTVLCLSTTQHSSAPEVPGTNRINSFFLQGAVVSNAKANTKISVVFSFPDDFKTSVISGFDDIILPGGRMGPKFCSVIKELYTMLEEQE